MSKKTNSKLSESFIIGVIAVVFLMIGYQTALFIHNAAVMKIAANRDEPDTIYIYESPVRSGDAVPALITPSRLEGAGHQPTASASGLSSGLASRLASAPPDPTSSQRSVSERRNAPHSPRIEAVRSNLPRRRTESFRFNPNTVSIEDLCRLGFTQKQAQSIENYRNKGGRFRRKEDFAKSFVVADSVYRRLEAYIDIPKLDLNMADSAAFDALPGIGGWFASKMIQHRKALGGYSYKEQLLDIYRFDEEKYKALEDLVEVAPENVTPYPLWTLPADSLRRHPYIRNYEIARAIVLFRENNPKSDWTVSELLNSGVISIENADKLARCRIENP